MHLRYRLTHNPLMLALAVIFFLLFCALSLWQVARVFEKQQQLARIQQANDHQALALESMSAEEMLRHRYYRINARGYFLPKQCIFVENVIFKRKPGLYVYCPFRISGQRQLLLVNMGWMPQLRERLQLPGYDPGGDPVSIEGMLSDPRSKPVVTASSVRPNSELEQLWTYFDFDALRSQSGQDFYPLELRLTTKKDDGLQRDWPRFEAKTGMHIGYAIHWAVFALVTLGLYLKFNLKRLEYD